jgi:hypothetical protein
MSHRLPSLTTIFVLICALAFAGCGKNSTPTAADSHLKSLGTIEVTARLLEIPEGAIFQRDLYDYATILKYQITSVERGSLNKGDIIYVAHYNPWKPRSDAADNRAKNIGGNLRQFRPGQLHHMALEVPLDDHFMGGVVDKYFGKHTGPIYWAVWTDETRL